MIIKNSTEPPMEWLAALEATWNKPERALAGFAAMKTLVQYPVKEGPIEEDV